MPRKDQRREYPLSVRLRYADISIIDRAARIRRRSRTDFVRDAAVRAAEDVLMEMTPIHMSANGFDGFMEVLSGPPTPVPEIVELLHHAAPWETNGSEVRK